MTLNLNPVIAGSVIASTAITDAAYVLFNAAVSARRRVIAANEPDLTWRDLPAARASARDDRPERGGPEAFLRMTCGPA